MTRSFLNHSRTFFVTLLVLFGPANAHAETIAPQGKVVAHCDEERDDDIWLISTRHLGCAAWEKTDFDVDLHVRHYAGKGEWNDATLDDFLHGGPADQPTLFYLHGNRVDSCDAIRRGSNTYHGILDCSGASSTRFVIWSWPSDKVKGIAKDIRSKAARTNTEAHYFAWLLAQLEPTTPVSILGYSFGARVTSGALHVLSGGTLAGRTLPNALHRPAGSYRVALPAAALHSHWLSPNGCHELATNQMEHLLIQYNSCDPVLKRYHMIERRAHPSALGYTGMYVDESVAASVEQYDMCSSVGKTHAEVKYTSSPTVMDQTRQALIYW